MRRWFRNQLMLDLAPAKNICFPKPRQGLLQALADFLEALGKQNNGIAAGLEACGASQDHA